MPNLVSTQQACVANNSTTSCADIAGKNANKDENNALHGARFVMHVVKANHFRSQCKQTQRKKTHGVTVSKEFDGSSSECDIIDCVTLEAETISTVNQQQHSKEIHTNMLIKGVPVRFPVDLGASVNVIQGKYADGYEIKPTKCVLQMWNKTQLTPEVTCRMTIRNP